MSITFAGSWADLQTVETFTVSETTVKSYTGKYRPERIVEITHNDNSVKSFPSAVLNQQITGYTRLIVFDNMNDFISAGCYLNGTSNFGTLKSVSVYPITAREDQLRLATPCLIPIIQKIVNSYLNFSEPETVTKS